MIEDLDFENEVRLDKHNIYNRIDKQHVPFTHKFYLQSAIKAGS